MHALNCGACMVQGCLVISDQLNHASIVTGARASGAKVKVFRHNDAAHLEAVLRTSIAEGQPRTHRPWKKVGRHQMFCEAWLGPWPAVNVGPLAAACACQGVTHTSCRATWRN